MRKKVLIYNPYWDTMGGGERYSAQAAAVFLNRGWQVDLVWSSDLRPAVKSRFGIDLSRARVVSDYWTAKYDVVFWVSDGTLPVSFAKKTLIHFQFPFTGIGGRSPGNFIKSRMYKFVVNSRFTKGFIDREFGVDSQVLYPPIDTAVFRSGKKTNTILYVGRFSQLTQLKNPHLLVDIFRDIYSRIPGWQLILAGGSGVGADKKYLSDLKKSIGTLPVSLVLNPGLEDLKKLYGRAKIFWSATGFGADEKTQPLKVEHFGISLVEAMSAGCVPVVSDLGGYREIITTGRDGFLCSRPAALGQVTRKLVSHPELLTALSKTARQKSKIFDSVCFTAGLQSLVS
jgi:glycosyltransferase involved in cell wall biosynthesis